MENIYLALVDTPGFFASIIRKTIGIPYVHVAIALDPQLTEAYSVGRRNPFIPLIAGFEQEQLPAIYRAFPTARYKIPFYQKRHFTCSSFVAKLLSESGLELFDKHFSLVTPRDFYELPQTKLIYEGSLAAFLHLSYDNVCLWNC